MMIHCGHVRVAQRSIFATMSFSVETEDSVVKLAARDAYSYRRDNTVLPFDDRGPVVFMDAIAFSAHLAQGRSRDSIGPQSFVFAQSRPPWVRAF
jgi:hypothetical protein